MSRTFVAVFSPPPHVYTLPSAVRAIDVSAPAAIATTLLTPSAITGSGVDDVSDPSCPESFEPHVQTEPSAFNATV